MTSTTPDGNPNRRCAHGKLFTESCEECGKEATTTFFTADTHFGHKRIIELAKRPFSSLEEMDEAMIVRWNERVGRDDIVIHLGDFSFAPQGNYLHRLHGHKYLVTGNHDPKRMKQERPPGHWREVYDSYVETKVGDDFLVLCHYGLRVWNRSHHGAIHLYGHSHGNLPGDSQSCDVGVDCWDFRPVTLDEIKARLATLPKRFEPDHHQPKP